MNSAELKEQQDKERQEDEAKATEMIKDAKVSMDRVTSAKRTQDLEVYISGVAFCMQSVSLLHYCPTILLLG